MRMQIICINKILLLKKKKNNNFKHGTFRFYQIFQIFRKGDKLNPPVRVCVRMCILHGQETVILLLYYYFLQYSIITKIHYFNILPVRSDSLFFYILILEI